MVIYHYVDIIWRILVTLDFLYDIYDHERYYPGEPVNIHMQPLINIIQYKDRVIITKKVEDNLPLFCGNGERVTPIYDKKDRIKICEWLYPPFFYQQSLSTTNWQ